MAERKGEAFREGLRMRNSRLPLDHPLRLHGLPREKRAAAEAEVRDIPATWRRLSAPGRSHA